MATFGPKGPAPAASSPASRSVLTAQRRRDSKPELALRRAAHALGLRYQVDAPIPGTRRRADLLFPTERIAVFLDGCFWHACPDHGTQPASNSSWWAEKLTANVARDRDTDSLLEDAGWLSLRFWEHEDPALAARVVQSAVLQRRSHPSECYPNLVAHYSGAPTVEEEVRHE